MDEKTLLEKIEKMRKGLANAAIQGETRAALERSLAKAEAELAAMKPTPVSQPAKDFLKDHIIIGSVPKYDTAPKPKPFSWNDYPLCKKFMPRHQQKAVQGFNEEREAILRDVEAMLAKIPGAYSQEKSADPTVWAHYFYGQSDWFVTEYHPEKGAPEYDRLFGFAILNGDSQVAELGYMSVAELTESNRVELDFYWKPVPLSVAKFNADPKYFDEPLPKAIQPSAPAAPPATVEEAVVAIAAPEPAATGLGCNVTRNLRKNGVEIRFKNPVSAEVSAKLKAKGFNFSRFQNIWYNRYSEATHQWALDLCGDTEHSDNPAAVVLQGPSDNANVRLITLASLTSRGKVPQGLLKDEIRAGKLEVAQYKRFDGMTDSTEYFKKEDLAWETATMNDPGLDMDELRKNSANKHWTSSITLENDGTIEYGNLRFRYKTSVEGHDYNPGEERSKIKDIEQTEKQELKKQAAQVLDLSPLKYHVPFNRPGKQGTFVIPDEERINPQAFVGGEPFPATMEYDGYKVVGTLGTKNVVTSTSWTFGSKTKEEKREDVWDFKPDDMALSPYAVNLSRFRKKQPGDASDFPGWKLPSGVRDVWDDMKRRVQDANYESAKMNEKGKTERGKKIHEGKMKEALMRLNLFKKIWVAYEEINPAALRKVTGEGPAEQAYRLMLWKKDLSMAQPSEAALQAARQAAEAELRGVTVAEVVPSNHQPAQPPKVEPQPAKTHLDFKIGDTVRVNIPGKIYLGNDQYGESPYHNKTGSVVHVQDSDIRVAIPGLTGEMGEGFLPEHLEVATEKAPHAPKFKRGDTALYNGKTVKLLTDGNYDNIARYYVYSAKAESWDDPDNVGEPYLTEYVVPPAAAKFQKGDRVVNTAKNQTATIFKVATPNDPRVLTAYSVRHNNGDESYWYEDEIKSVKSTQLLQPKYSVGDTWEAKINGRKYRIMAVYPSTPKSAINDAGDNTAAYLVQEPDAPKGVRYEEEWLDSKMTEHYIFTPAKTAEKQPFRLLGRKIQIHLPNGEQHEGQFAIVELDNITASHDERTFAPSPDYPLNAQGRNANDRNYTSDKAAQALVQEYARDLKPELLITTSRTPEGTPIITPDGIVLSGNNRTMSLKRAAIEYPEKYAAYVAFLKEELKTFGFKEGEFWGEFQYPVLVRIDYDIPEVTTNVLAQYNQATTKGARPIDKSIALSARLEETLCGTNIPQIIGAFDTLSDFYANRNAQKQVKEQLIGCGLLTQQEVPTYYDDGTFNDEGKTFIERTLAASILTPDALQAAEADGVKALRKAVVNALPVLLQNKGLEQGSLIAWVNEAVIFQQKMVASKLSFGDFLGQKSIFDTGDTAHAWEAVALNRLMNAGQRIFKTAVGKYNDSMKANEGDSLFGAGDKVTPSEAFEKLIFAALPEGDQMVIRRHFAGEKPANNRVETAAPAPEPIRAIEIAPQSKAELIRVLRRGIKLYQVEKNGTQQEPETWEVFEIHSKGFKLRNVAGQEKEITAAAMFFQFYDDGFGLFGRDRNRHAAYYYNDPNNAAAPAPEPIKKITAAIEAIRTALQFAPSDKLKAALEGLEAAQKFM